MTNFQHIQDHTFFQRGSPQFEELMSLPANLLRIDSVTRQRINAVKKEGDRLIIKLDTNAAIIRKIN